MLYHPLFNLLFMSTNTKTIIWSISGLIVIAGALYFNIIKNPREGMMQENKTSTGNESVEPAKNASNEEIIDYLVDYMTKDGTSSAEASMDSTTPSSQTASNVNTNF